ncbi:hypothetical protein BASA62_009746 [Batrachochytrium salamandrivorans]|nr:hypothetical protein BASA62_009746 [Batrachochytrium salamandrivorans]
MEVGMANTPETAVSTQDESSKDILQTQPLDAADTSPEIELAASNEKYRLISTGDGTDGSSNSKDKGGSSDEDEHDITHDSNTADSTPSQPTKDSTPNNDTQMHSQQQNDLDLSDVATTVALTTQASIVAFLQLGDKARESTALESTIAQIQAHVQQNRHDIDTSSYGVFDAHDLSSSLDPAVASSDPSDLLSSEFARIIYSDDRIHPLSKTARTMTSPIPANYDSVLPPAHVDYEEDQDVLHFGLTMIMSRSESVDDFQDDTVNLTNETSICQGGAFITHPLTLLRPTSPTDRSENQSATNHTMSDRTERVGTNPTADCNDITKTAPSLDLAEKDTSDTHSSTRCGTGNNRDVPTFQQPEPLVVIDREKSDDTREGKKSVSDQEQRYTNCMASLNELQAEYNLINSTNQNFVGDYKTKLEERLQEVTLKSNEFWNYKRVVSLSAENSRTGKTLPVYTIDQLESTERKKENEVVTVRLDNIKLRNKLRRHEQLLRQKEELADGLHLIDFEQLKIENQTFNEKIEERNDELLKLRKKITNVVQVLTHVKEKLQFVQCETVDLKQELISLEDEVAKRRDLLPLEKQDRDDLRNTNINIRQKNGLLGNNNLLYDYGEKVDESKELNHRINSLQQHYDGLMNETQRLHQKMQKLQFLSSMKNAYAIE